MSDSYSIGLILLIPCLHPRRVDQLVAFFLVLFESHEANLLETIPGQDFRSPPGAASAVSTSDQQSVFGNLLESRLKLAHGYVYVTINGAQLFDLLWLPHIEEEELHFFVEEFLEAIGGEFGRSRNGLFLGEYSNRS